MKFLALCQEESNVLDEFVMAMTNDFMAML